MSYKQYFYATLIFTFLVWVLKTNNLIEVR